MRKHPQTANRHRFGFDLLEGRQLLSGGFSSAPQHQFVVAAYGTPANSGGLSGHDSREDESRVSPQMDGPSWGEPGTDDPAAARSDGADGMADGTQSSPTGSSITTPPADSPSGAGGMTPAGSYGSSAGGATLEPGDAPVAGSPQAVIPSMNLPSAPSGNSPTPYAPVGFEMSGRSENAGPSFFMIFSLASPAGPSAMARGRSDPFDLAGPTTGPTNTPGSPNAPGVQALSSQVTGLATSITIAGSPIQAATSATSLPIQTVTITDSDSSRAEHPASAVGPASRTDARGAVQAGRLDNPLGRSILTTTFSHSGLISTADFDAALAHRDAASLLPRGADLIAEALPFARGSLERSLDEFVRQLEGVDVAGLVRGGPSPVVVASLAALSTAASALVVREIVRRRSVRGRGVRMMDHLGRELALSFPELPRSWSERR
jgi:hypothetical protein